MSLTAEQIKKSREAKPETQKVSTPEWGKPGTKSGHVYVRTVSAMAISEMQRIRELPLFAKDPNTGALIGWCVVCVCGKHGERLFGVDDAGWLANDLEVGPVMRCAAAAQAINGSDKETAGNSQTSQSDGSP